MKNILIVAHLGDLSGANLALVELVEELKKSKKFNILVMLPKKGELSNYLNDHCINYIVLRSGMWVKRKEENFCKTIVKQVLNFIGEYKFRSILKKFNIHLVHYNTSVYGVGVRTLYKSGKIPYIFHIREFAKNVFNLDFYDEQQSMFLISQSEAIITVSKSIEKYFSNILKIDNIRIIYDGIPLLSNKKIVRKFDVPEILMVGAIAQDKGQLEAIQAIKILKNIFPNIKLTVIGKTLEKDYRERIDKFIIENKLQKHISIDRYRRDLTKLREQYDFVYVCSKNEAFGRVTVEALQFGQIVFGANTGGTKEIINDKKNGFLYEQGNSMDLARKFLEVFQNESLKVDVSSEAWVSSRKVFDINKSVELIRKLYIEVLNDYE